MILTVEALKGLYSALGGNSANVADETLIPDMIKHIAALISSGGATVLPHVSSADNGKVLTVVNGAWAVATPAAELPTVTSSNNGEILTVSGGNWVSAVPASQLPTVTATDNGDVLTVVEGVWAAAALPTT